MQRIVARIGVEGTGYSLIEKKSSELMWYQDDLIYNV